MISPRPDPRPPGISPSTVEVLQEEIVQLRKQKAELIQQIVEASQTRQDDLQTIEKLANDVSASDKKIQELEQKLDRVGVLPLPVRQTAPLVGVSLDALRAAVRRIEPDLGGCFAEWDERSIAADAQLTIHVRVFPDGHVRTAEPRGLDDTVARVCVNLAASRLILPVSEVVTVFDIDARYLSSLPAEDGKPPVDGRLAVTLYRQGTEPAPPLIDIPGR